MKKKINTSIYFFIVSLYFTLSCQNTSQRNKNYVYFEDITWKYGNQIVIKNDSCLSPSKFDKKRNEFTNDSSFYIYFTDSTLIYTRYEKQGNYENQQKFNITGLEKKTDTVKYDFKYINKMPKLILYLNPFPIILSTEKNLKLAETNNLEHTKFVVSDYSISDQIDRTQIKTRGIYNYPNYSIEDCQYLVNKDITFKIIGYNTIYSIERENIEPYRLKEVIKVVSHKLKAAPEYRPMQKMSEDANYEYEFYRWQKKGVQITLSRAKYVGNEAYKTLIQNKNWTLSYDDTFLQAILIETYRSKEPKSTIIN